MANDNKTGVGGDLCAGIERIANIVHGIGRLRSLRAVVSAIGLALVAAAVGVFAYNVYSFAANYDRSALADSLQAKGVELLKSREAMELLSVAKDDIIPEFKAQLLRRLEEDMPKFQAEAAAAAAAIHSHLHEEVRKRLEDTVDSCMKEISETLLKHHKQVDVDKMQAVFEKAQERFLLNVEKSFSKHWDAVSVDLALLNEAILSLGSPDELARIEALPPRDQESALVEAMLELAVFHINPVKGAKPAAGLN